MYVSNIQIIKYRDLNTEEKDSISRVVSEHRVSLLLKDLDRLVLQIKKYRDFGDRIKYSLRARGDGNGTRLEATSYDWDLRAALHKLFSKLRTEYEHKKKDKGFKKYMKKYFGKRR